MFILVLVLVVFVNVLVVIVFIIGIAGGGGQGHGEGRKAKYDLALIEVSLDNKKTLCDTLKETGDCNICSALFWSMCSFKQDLDDQLLTVKQQVKKAKYFRQKSYHWPTWKATMTKPSNYL